MMLANVISADRTITHRSLSGVSLSFGYSSWRVRMFDRYSRQIRFAGIGETGQSQLNAARVAIVGLGATGSAIFHTLLRSGVGHLRIIDRDWVEEHNLPRQTLYTEADAAALTPKAVAAATHAQAINSHVQVEPLVLDLNANTIDMALQGVNLVLDGGDNLALRYLINEWCVRERIPWIYSGVLAAHGMTATFMPDQACFRCAFPPQPNAGALPTCETAGVIAPIVQVLANCAAAEAIKLITGNGRLNTGLLTIDLWNWTFDQLPLPPRQPDCPVCAKHEWQMLDQDHAQTVALCGRDAIQIRQPHPSMIDLAQFAHRLQIANIAVQHNQHLVRFAADEYRVTLFADGRAIISGTDNEIIARNIYARWIGH